jgi:hypothetical protein
MTLRYVVYYHSLCSLITILTSTASKEQMSEATIKYLVSNFFYKLRRTKCTMRVRRALNVCVDHNSLQISLQRLDILYIRHGLLDYLTIKWLISGRPGDELEDPHLSIVEHSTKTFSQGRSQCALQNRRHDGRARSCSHVLAEVETAACHGEVLCSNTCSELNECR